MKANLLKIFQKKNSPSYSVINNPQGFKCLAFLSMLYLCIMLFNAILTNRSVGTNSLFVLGGTITSPIVFLIDNIIAEIYGFKITRSIIFFSLIVQTIFVVLCQLIIQSPAPIFFHENNFYSKLLGTDLIRIHLSNCFAYVFAILINTKILTQWKVLLKGKKFWLRSIGSNTIAEALYSFIAIILMELQAIPLTQIFKLLAISYLIKLSYSIILAYPLQIIINIIRNTTGIDVYDFDYKFIPSKYYRIAQEF